MRSSGIREDYLSKENTDCVKGVFALFVVTCHCRNFMTSLNDTILGMILTSVGYLSVAVFFFFSGYGLETQYQKRGKDYIKDFPKHRILPLYAICVLAVLFYAVYRTVLFEKVPMLAIVKSLLFGSTIMSYGWYLQASVLLYLLYYLARRFLPEEKCWIGLLLGGGIYVFLSGLLTSGLLYVQSILAFPLGLLLAHRKLEFDRLCSKKWWAVFFASFAAFSVTLLVGNLPIGPKLLWIPSLLLSSAFFAIFVLMLLQKIRVDFPPIRKLGTLFSEIYIAQEVPISLLRSQYVYIENDYLYLAAVLIAVVVLGIVIHPVFSFVQRTVKNLGSTPKVVDKYLL